MILRTLSLFLTFITSFCVYANAQKFKFSWSEDERQLKNDFDVSIKTANGNSILSKFVRELKTFSGAEYKPTLTLIGKNNEKIKETKINIDEKEVKYSGLKSFKGNIFLFYEAYSKAEKASSFYALKIDENNLTYQKITLFVNYETDFYSIFNRVFIETSSDTSKVVIVMEGAEKKKENLKYCVGMFDNALNKIWIKNTEASYTSKFAFIKNCSADNNGNAFLTLKLYDKETSYYKNYEGGARKANFTDETTLFTSSGQRILKIDLGANTIHCSSINFNKTNSTLLISGLYRTSNESKAVAGVFLGSINPQTNLVTNTKLYPFTKEIIDGITKDGFGSKEKSEIGIDKYFDYVFILTRPNGSIDLITSFQETDEVPVGASGNTAMSYRSGSIISTNIDKDGKAIFTRIPKDQKIPKAGSFTGHFAFIYKDDLVLIYSDDEDNVTNDLSKSPIKLRNYRKSVLAAAIVATNGNLNRQVIYNNDNEGYVAEPGSITQTSKNTFFLEALLWSLTKYRTRYGIMTVE